MRRALGTCSRVGNVFLGIWDPLILCPHIILEIPRGNKDSSNPKKWENAVGDNPKYQDICKIIIAPWRNKNYRHRNTEQINISNGVAVCVCTFSTRGKIRN